MKKLVRLIALSLLSAGFITGAASAQTSVSNTGPDSTVTITSNQSCRVTVNNDTNIGVVNNNNQAAFSGNASTTRNTTGGSATSGNASNSNSVSASFSVINTAPTAGTGTGGGACALGSTTGGNGGGGNGGGTVGGGGGSTPLRPSGRVLGGSGSGGRTVAAASTIAALPNTGSNNTPAIIGVALVMLGSVAVASQLGVKAYKSAL